jgi:hypothetical protein
MEAVAASLSNVHALVRVARPAPDAEPMTVPLAQRLPVPPPVAPAPPVHADSAAFPLVQAPPREGIGVTMQSAQPLEPARFPAPVPVAVEVARAPAPAARPAQPHAIPPPRGSQPQGTPSVDVELGTHSVSNFYKGLGGNDVNEHGGIFVATYKLLKIGSTVALRVLLPGNYEFTASGVVQWTREASSTEPGFGARFTQISAEGRQLVYRYTRNREPMFYDDL